MLKHVGTHNNQKITIILHQMPTEDHMCLVVYNDKLPPRYHDALQKVLRSEEGQKAKDFADALEHASLEDGRNLAKVLYTEGHLKKVPTNQVFATPYGYESPNKIKLDELNKLLTNIEAGGESLQKLKTFDEGIGMNIKRKDKITESLSSEESSKIKRIIDSEKEHHSKPSAATELLTQSKNLENMASQLIEQAKLLNQHAEKLLQPKAPTSLLSENAIPKKRLAGRPRKK